MLQAGKADFWLLLAAVGEGSSLCEKESNAVDSMTSLVYAHDSCPCACSQCHSCVLMQVLIGQQQSDSCSKSGAADAGRSTF